MPAVCVYWLMRFLAASFKGLLFGASPMTFPSSQVASPIFRQPSCSASLMRNTYISFSFREEKYFIGIHFRRSIYLIRLPLRPV